MPSSLPPVPHMGEFAVFHGPGIPLELNRQELPQLKPGEILVQNEYTTLCRSDLYTYAGKRHEKCPTILGHEIVGRIMGFGTNEDYRDVNGRPLEIGQRITWGIFSSNPASPMARKGIPQKANDLFKYGHETWTEESGFHGGLSTHTQLRANTPVILVSEEVPLPTVSLINCAVATVAGSLRLVGEMTGHTVVVSGTGMLGIVACAMSHVIGANEIIAVDINPTRLEVARKFGATQTAHPKEMKQFHRKADQVLEYSGVGTAMEASLDWVKIGGTVAWVGGTFPQAPIQIDPEAIIRNLITIKGLHNYNTQDLVRAVSFIEQAYDQFPFEELVHEIPLLDQVESAFQLGLNANPFRVGIKLT